MTQADLVPLQSVTKTPILDSAVLPPRKPKRLGIGIGLGVGTVIGLWLGNGYNDVEPGHPEILAIIGVVVLAIVVHELGHLLAGSLVGFHFNSFGIGPVVLAIEHGRPKIRLRLGTSYAGYVSMQVGAIRRLRRRFLIFVIGGPAANLLSVPMTALFVNYVFPAWSHSWLSIPAGQFAAISLLFGFLGFVPISDGSDGQRISMLLGQPVAARRFLSFLALGSQARNGIRPQRWRRTWLKAATQLQDGRKDEFYGKWMAYASANDAKDADLAAVLIERCLELAQPRSTILRDTTIREAAVFSAWFRRDAHLAEKWLAQLQHPKQVSPLLKFRTEIAILSVHSRFDECLARWQEGFAFIENMPPVPNKASLREGWLEWRGEIEQRRGRLYR